VPRVRRALLALGLCAACGSPDADLPAPYRRLAVPVERLADAASIQRGKALFLTHCAICHGERADGRGLRGASMSHPPADLTRPDWRRQATPRRLYFVVSEGLRGTPMPAWKGTLDAEEIWDLTAYLRSLTHAPAPVASRRPSGAAP
jgi:mono/diheme cytochrome c family protein